MGMMDAVPADCLGRPPEPWDHGRPPLMVQGQPLLELLSLSANFLVKGTIAVFDGKRGQIIYENYDQGQADDHPLTCISNTPEAGFTSLILTGPYRAISADGESFAIKLGTSGPNEDESDGATELWECNICEADDSIVESVISTEEGEILVTYAVLSNAVEATVQVNLVGFAAQTHVYGKITAHIRDFDDKDNVLLLSRPARDPAQLIASSDAAFIVPLSRSIIAVPLGSPIVIVVDIYATSIHRDTAPARFLGNRSFAFGEDTQIQTAIGDLTISVDISHPLTTNN